MISYWWCDKCEEVVPPTEVTFEEFHDVCGYGVGRREDRSGEKMKRPTRVLVHNVWKKLCYCEEPSKSRVWVGCSFCGGLLTM